MVFREKKYQVTYVLCLSAYQDDFDENSELVREWLQCTRESCAKWMHQDCIREDNDIHMWRIWKFLLLHYTSAKLSLLIIICRVL